MLTNQVALIIHRPVAQVFAFVSWLENREQWCARVVQTRATSPGTTGLGATFHEVFHLILGRKGDADYRITEYEPDKRIMFASTAGSVRVQEILAFESLADGARVTQTTQSWFTRFKLFEPLFKRMGERMAAANLVR